MFKNKFLSSVAYFYGPADKPGETGGDDTNDDVNDDVDNNVEGDDGDGDDNSSDDGDEGSDDGEGDDEGDEGSDDDEGGEPDPKASKADKEDWRDRQLAKQHRKLQEARRIAAEKDFEIQTLRALAEGREPPKKPDGAAAGDAPVSKDEAVRIAKQELTMEEAQTKFDTDCNNAYADGKKRFKGWDKILSRLPVLGGVDNETMQYVLATDDPAQALFTMASDPDEYERIMTLPPARRATALAKVGAKKAPDRKRPSDAPEPVVPINKNNRTSHKGRVNPADPSSDKASDEEWYKERDRQRAERFAKKNGR